MEQHKKIFYGRRKGRPLGEQRLHWWERCQKLSPARWGLHSLDSWYAGAYDSSAEKPASPILQAQNDLAQIPSKLWMEIGCGYGEYLHQFLQQETDAAILGVEVFQPALAHLVLGVSESDFGRCSVFPWPVGWLWPHLPSACLDGVVIFFPDPWPKFRHHKRRLIQEAFLKVLGSFLKPGGELRLATDHLDLAKWMLIFLNHRKDFFPIEGIAGLAPDALKNFQVPWPESWPSTRYQRRGQRLGHSIFWGRWCFQG